MGDNSSIGFLLLLVSLISLSVKCYSTSEDDLKSYIVYTGNSRSEETSALLHYKTLLQQVATNSTQEPKSILQYYKRTFNGFVAKLTQEEANKMAGLEGVVSVFPNEKRHLLTTKSWDFIGLAQYARRQDYESDIVIGVIDSGIWPESASFNDKGFSPPPTKWKGICETSNFTCNNKIIGARYHKPQHVSLSPNDIESPRDISGHGTHTSSIAAGNPVRMASMLGLAEGTSGGGTPSARIAIYKACWFDGCYEESILAAFDHAIADGVDILSVSIGEISSDNNTYFRDSISIGAFHAMKHGVLTVVAAGNSGPHNTTLENFQPWTIIVAASTLDRKFVTKVKLGDNTTYEGISLNTFDLGGKLYPIIYGGDAQNTTAGVPRHISRFCSTNTLDEKLVKGKIVLCDGIEGTIEASRVGAIGVLMQSDYLGDSPTSYPVPACVLQSKDATNIHNYISSTRNPMATIYRTNELKDTSAPVVASFSSRGPNRATNEILKPDLTAPGVDILASWSRAAPISTNIGENRKLEFNIMSGTSMACPHVSGAAAYVKSFHPTWSPAAIRSALMTTAKQMSSENNPDAEFGYGAGQIDPDKAVNPGLIYDANEDDYVKFLCGHGFDRTTLQHITGRDEHNCSDTTNSSSSRDLNYPSFALNATDSKHHLSVSFRRSVTNVGLPASAYKATVTASEGGLNISVDPSVLSFTSLGETQTYVLTIDGKMEKSIVSESLVWDDGKFNVRSPIIIFAEGANNEVDNEVAEKSATSPNYYVPVLVVVVIFILNCFIWI